MNEVTATLPGVGYRHQREDMLAAAVTVAHRDGLAALTYGRVAKELGTNDRTVVYYFPTKTELIGAVILTLGGQLQQALADAFGDGPLPPAELFERAWPALADADSVFGLFFQIVGLAAAGTKPYDSIAPALVEQWLTWLEPRVAVQGAARRRREALALMARIDGLLLLRQTLGAAAADGAAEVITLG